MQWQPDEKALLFIQLACGCGSSFALFDTRPEIRELLGANKGTPSKLEVTWSTAETQDGNTPITLLSSLFSDSVHVGLEGEPVERRRSVSGRRHLLVELGLGQSGKDRAQVPHV